MSEKMHSADSLGNRMKSYEELSTSRQLMPNCPIYARIDGRAFHTFCRGLQKPYSKAFIEAMQETCRHLVKETTAILGYVQSDEISLGWIDSQHCPFDGRVQKLESVLASMAGAFFVHFIGSRQHTAEFAPLQDRVDRCIPCFDCRVFNVPTLEEFANSFLWRENDAIKNSISGMALDFYSHKELQGKNSDEKVHMMRMKGYCFFEDTEEAFLRGTFWHRENYLKKLTHEELAKIPEKQKDMLLRSNDGLSCCRTRIAKVNIPYRLTDIENKVGVLFEGQEAILNKTKPTFAIKTEKTIA